jgi:cell wall-associated NlpC family hydrolase
VSDADRTLLRRWEDRARAEGLDPRVDFWQWEPRRGGVRLLLRPGPAAAAARAFAREQGLKAEQWLVLKEESSHRVEASRSALRRGPGHDREQISQLRLGEAFVEWHRDPAGQWCLGAGADGYPGWLRAWHLVPDSGPKPGAAPGLVTARSSRLHAEPAASAAVLHDLSFGSRLEAQGDAINEFTPCRLPGGGRAWAPSADLGSSPLGAVARLEALRTWGERLLGVPYEWGGTSSWGLDCSGLIQTLFGALGIALPRDADLQARCGNALDAADPGSWRPGDLVFYGRERVDHVGLLLEGGRLLHARGFVRLETLEKDGALETLPPRAVRRFDLA